jgi:hypothetical protein
MSSNPQPLRRPPPPPGQGISGQSQPSEATPVYLSFNIPFSYNLQGPEKCELLHSSPGAEQRWTFSLDTPDGTPLHKLPVHVQNEERLRTLCQYLSDQTGGRIRATVTSSEPKTGPALHRKSQSLVTNVCVSGDGDLVYKIRARILNETPIMMVRKGLQDDGVIKHTDIANRNRPLWTWILISSSMEPRLASDQVS